MTKVRVVSDIPELVASRRPATFRGFEFVVAAEVEATLAVMRKATALEESTDELGKCWVSHFQLRGIAAYFYRSEHHPAKVWMLFVDLKACVANETVPTWAASRIIDTLKLKGAVWLNKPLDSVYRSRRVGTSMMKIIKTPREIPRAEVGPSAVPLKSFAKVVLTPDKKKELQVKLKRTRPGSTEKLLLQSQEKAERRSKYEAVFKAIARKVEAERKKSAAMMGVMFADPNEPAEKAALAKRRARIKKAAAASKTVVGKLAG